MSSIGEEPSSLPEVQDVKLEVSRLSAQQVVKEEKFVETFSQLSLDSERKYVHIIGLEIHYRHKAIWSWFLMGLMAVMVIFQIVLLCLVGVGIWSFEKYIWLLPALLVQNLGQIVGLAVFVVRSLFRNID